MVMRGGSSKGLYFVESDLPADPDERERILLTSMGSPDARQIDGMGGAHPLTSKVAIVAPCDHGVGNVDYLFLQIGVDEAIVTDRQNCGNILAGVGPFAVERGLMGADGTEIEVRIHMLNTDGVAVAGFPIEDGVPLYSGDTSISGVPGTAAAIRLEFEGIAGGSSGNLLPTGNVVDEIEGVRATLVDNGMPVVVMKAEDLGITGYESCEELEANESLRTRLEEIRLVAGPMMNLGDVSETTVPKLTMVAAPKDGGDLCTRTFIPYRCHQAIGVLGAVSVATAALLPGAPASALLDHDGGEVVKLEHPTGTFEAVVDVEIDAGVPVVSRAGIIRTARKLMDGYVFPRSQ